ncbi:MAG: PilZ domain-containing protein, partial [Desulfobacterales bacterium]
MFEYETSSRRTYVRVVPSGEEPVIVRFENHDMPAHTIGAGGLSFQNYGFTKGDVSSATFNLPGFASAISADITIVDVCRHDVCHCEFTDIQEDERELLHQYC